MNHQIVKSSAIKSIGYDEAKREMEIHFHGGRSYRYSEVEPEDHAALVSADSVGAHFSAHVRTKYEGRRHK